MKILARLEQVALRGLREVLWTESGRQLLERLATSDPDVGVWLLERLARRYDAKLEMRG